MTVIMPCKKQERKFRQPDYLPLINSPKRNFYLCPLSFVITRGNRGQNKNKQKNRTTIE